MSFDKKNVIKDKKEEIIEIEYEKNQEKKPLLNKEKSNKNIELEMKVNYF